MHGPCMAPAPVGLSTSGIIRVTSAETGPTSHVVQSSANLDSLHGHAAIAFQASL